MSASLTVQQAKALAFIEGYIGIRKGIGPTYSEIARELGLRSKGNVHRIVHALKERGVLKTDSRYRYGRARHFDIVRKTCPHCGHRLGAA